MTRCLRDRTLFLLYDGEGTSAQRTHLTECETCAARYRRLERDVKAIGEVLREEPPPKTVSHRFQPATVRWLPTAAVVALALVLVWGGVRMWSPSVPLPLKGTDNEEIWSLSEEFSRELFLLNQPFAGELWAVSADPYDVVAAALESGRPCEWYDMLPRSEGNPLMEDLETFGRPLPSCVEHYQSNKERLPNPKT